MPTRVQQHGNKRHHLYLKQRRSGFETDAEKIGKEVRYDWTGDVRRSCRADVFDAHGDIRRGVEGAQAADIAIPSEI